MYQIKTMPDEQRQMGLHDDGHFTNYDYLDFIKLSISTWFVLVSQRGVPCSSNTLCEHLL